MHVDMEDWKNGWYGIDIGLDRNEIDTLIGLLQMIRDDPEQHFHLSSKFEGEGGIGDIEFYIKEQKQENNMKLLGKAIEPDAEI